MTTIITDPISRCVWREVAICTNNNGEPITMWSKDGDPTLYLDIESEAFDNTVDKLLAYLEGKE